MAHAVHGRSNSIVGTEEFLGKALVVAAHAFAHHLLLHHPLTLAC